MEGFFFVGIGLEFNALPFSFDMLFEIDCNPLLNLFRKRVIDWEDFPTCINEDSHNPHERGQFNLTSSMVQRNSILLPDFTQSQVFRFVSWAIDDLISNSPITSIQLSTSRESWNIFSMDSTEFTKEHNTQK